MLVVGVKRSVVPPVAVTCAIVPLKVVSCTGAVPACVLQVWQATLGLLGNTTPACRGGTEAPCYDD